MNIFQDKTAIVTGGASGMGEAVCLKLGVYGANVIVADIQAEKAETVARQIRRNGGKAESVSLDVTDRDAVYGLVEDTAREYGWLDYMFNNAGIHLIGEVRDMEPGQWEKILQVNTLGVLYGTLAAYSIMIRQGKGNIVNTASMAGLTYMPLTVAYNMTKHAVSGHAPGMYSARGSGSHTHGGCKKQGPYHFSLARPPAVDDVSRVPPVHDQVRGSACEGFQEKDTKAIGSLGSSSERLTGSVWPMRILISSAHKIR